MAQAPRPTSSTSSTCQDVWCRKLTGAARTSTLWWSVEQRRNAPTSLIRSLTLKPSPSVKNAIVAWGSVLPRTACPSLRGRTRSVRVKPGGPAALPLEPARAVVGGGGHRVLPEARSDVQGDADAGDRLGGRHAISAQIRGQAEAGQAGRGAGQVVG